MRDVFITFGRAFVSTLKTLFKEQAERWSGSIETQQRLMKMVFQLLEKEQPGIAEALARLVASGRFNTVRDLLSEGLNDIHARKMDFMAGLPRYTVTYCQYEQDLPASERRMKPTDIWTNHPCPNFRPMCHNGDPCHASAPRGAKTGTQGLAKVDRSRIPDQLCNHIVDICELVIPEHGGDA